MSNRISGTISRSKLRLTCRTSRAAEFVSTLLVAGSVVASSQFANGNNGGGATCATLCAAAFTASSAWFANCARRKQETSDSQSDDGVWLIVEIENGSISHFEDLAVGFIAHIAFDTAVRTSLDVTGVDCSTMTEGSVPFIVASTDDALVACVRQALETANESMSNISCKVEYMPEDGIWMPKSGFLATDNVCLRY